MNAAPEGLQIVPPPNRAETLLRASVPALDQFALDLRPLRDALHRARELGNVPAIKSASRLLRQLDQFQPSVTMIGQIKSGKTTLVNSMVGWPDLLPADVNPWTSVVTSLHLCPRALTPPRKAKFRFFEEDEWDRLVRGGGRIGEMAGRAGADEELSAIKAQAEMMRAKAQERLGRKFEMLLGSEQTYGYFDKELIERYVCLGDEHDTQPRLTKSQGYFADITKSADLFMHQPALPINLCVRDTPGVNDTFMMREQITIKAIRDSRICVVVLSAHQALSSTDLALIRLISNVKSREVIIFVNRIDELSDPGKQVPQIRESIEKTLENHQGPADAEVIFGSALWAQTAAVGVISRMPKASQEALFNWAETIQVSDNHNGDAHGYVWELSGLPALFAAIGQRIRSGEGKELAAKVAVSTGNLLNGIRASDNLDAKSSATGAELKIPKEEFATALAELRRTREAELRNRMDSLQTALADRVGRSHQSFLARATEALAKHLENYGENSAWTYEPAGLRILLNSAYKSFGAKSQAAFTEAATLVVADLQSLCLRALGLGDDLFDPEVPQPPHIPAPVAIGQTIALDLRGQWWKGWWNRRRSYADQAQQFHDLIKSETNALVNDLVTDQATLVRQTVLSHLDGFLDDQLANVSSILEAPTTSAVKIDALLGVKELKEREVKLSASLTQLKGYSE